MMVSTHSSYFLPKCSISAICFSKIYMVVSIVQIQFQDLQSSSSTSNKRKFFNRAHVLFIESHCVKCIYFVYFRYVLNGLCSTIAKFQIQILIFFYITYYILFNKIFLLKLSFKNSCFKFDEFSKRNGSFSLKNEALSSESFR